jgi:hypothetical protein
MTIGLLTKVQTEVRVSSDIPATFIVTPHGQASRTGLPLARRAARFAPWRGHSNRRPAVFGKQTAARLEALLGRLAQGQSHAGMPIACPGSVPDLTSRTRHFGLANFRAN